MTFRNRKLIRYAHLSNKKKALLSKAMLRGDVQRRLDYPAIWMKCPQDTPLLAAVIYREVDDGSFKNKAKKKFKDLPQERRTELIERLVAGKVVEKLFCGTWCEVTLMVAMKGVYRWPSEVINRLREDIQTLKDSPQSVFDTPHLKEAPETSPVNWDDIPEEFNWIATDGSAGTWAYEDKPTKEDFTCGDWHWVNNTGRVRHLSVEVPEAEHSPIERPKK